MPILVQEIVNRSNAALDAEGSDRYLFDQDFKPAIRYAQEWVVLALNRGFEMNKHSGESLRELVKVSIWQANNFSRIAFDPVTMGHDLWSILALYPNPVVTPFSNPSPLPNKAESKYMPNLSLVSGKACTNRLTLEQWNDNVDNVFMPGNSVLSGPLSDFAYLNFADYSSSTYSNPGKFELEIRPTVANKYVGMAYLRRPKEINLITDTMEFPEALMNVILEKTLQYVSWKQGDQTTLYLVTDRDVNRLMTLIQ
jgi:hypothetical protein